MLSICNGGGVGTELDIQESNCGKRAMPKRCIISMASCGSYPSLAHRSELLLRMAMLLGDLLPPQGPYAQKRLRSS